jgi:hypothetical protein
MFGKNSNPNTNNNSNSNNNAAMNILMNSGSTRILRGESMDNDRPVIALSLADVSSSTNDELMRLMKTNANKLPTVPELNDSYFYSFVLFLAF